MSYRILIILDDKRMARIKGTKLESYAKGIYAGCLRGIDIDVDDKRADFILKMFPRSRIDSMGYIEELPVSFKQELFNALAESGDFSEAIDMVLKPDRLQMIKEKAAMEDEKLPVPNIKLK
ncbi:DUF6955 family protein [Thermoplasma sp.]|uniref:DUF6955 family protein n=1 Tax=Thermoplasma sp. TaxID=1973142 RepID=UPI00126EFCBC|nr:hypothetical protein [Thermoplasma sp.]KAA8921966.1 MAG: hypothetical protein F6Q11_06805 [Thermoplasma sp.]